MLKTIIDVRSCIKDYGFNPLVTTEGSLNTVDIKKALFLNSNTINYLKELNTADKNKSKAHS
jgi:hypothetical protein